MAPLPPAGRRAIAVAAACALAVGAAGAGPLGSAQPPNGSVVPARDGAAARGADADSVVAFHLSDQFGQVHDAAAYRGRGLLLVGAAGGGRAVGTEWVQALRGLQADTDGPGAVPVVAVADLRGLPRLLRRFARGKFPKDRRQPVLLDWDGSVARRLGFERDWCTIVVVGPTGVVLARSRPAAVDTSVARGLLRQAASPGQRSAAGS